MGWVSVQAVLTMPDLAQSQGRSRDYEENHHLSGADGILMLECVLLETGDRRSHR